MMSYEILMFELGQGKENIFNSEKLNTSACNIYMEHWRLG